MIDLIIKGHDEKIKIRLVDGFESQFYLEKCKIPVLEIKGNMLPATVTTIIKFKK